MQCTKRYATCCETFRKLARDSFVKPATPVGLLMLTMAVGCASLDFSPSSVETWSGPTFPADRVETIDVLPVVDARTVNRGSSVMTAQLVREAATSLLSEKGYAVTASGDALAAAVSTPTGAAALDPSAVADRCPDAQGFVLALAVENTDPDTVVSPGSMRVALRGAIVDVADRVVVWAGAAVAEAGSRSGAIARSPSATLYTAVYQAARALLADLPARPREEASAYPPRRPSTEWRGLPRSCYRWWEPVRAINRESQGDEWRCGDESRSAGC